MPTLRPRAVRRDRHPLLAHGDGRRIARAQLATALAHALAAIALPFLALERTGSVALAGLVGTAGAAAYVVAGLPAGLARRRGMRRRSLWAPHLLQALCIALLLAAGLVSPVPGWVVLAAAFGIMCLQAFVDSGFQSAVGAITREEGLLAGQSALGGADAIGRVAGLAVSGLAIALWGPALALALAAVAFTGGAVLALRLVEAPALVPRTRGVRASTTLTATRALALGDPVIRGFLVLGTAWNAVTVAAAMALIVPFLRMEAQLDPQASGMVMAGGAAAGVLATQATGRVAGTARAALVLLCAGGIGLLGIAVLGGLISLVAVFCVLSACQASLMVLVMTESQRRAPQALRPVLASLARVGLAGGFGLGSALYSLVAGSAGLRATYLLAGLLSLALAAAMVPLLARARRAPEAAPLAHPAVAAACPAG